MRHQWLEWDGNKVLLDAYNANPDSMHAAIKNFENLQVPGKIVVLGDMYELGNESKDEHQIIINLFDDCHFEEVLVCGAHFAEATALNDVRIFATFEDLQSYFQAKQYQGKTILIKGSRGMKMERLIGK
jgi:UDP-N-acetylmuramoyl-tripeptide--D-alanyl-D-alanine ligase